MHDLNLAELLLSLSTSAEHAAAIAGDLSETNTGRLRFWCAVVHVWLSLAWKQCAGSVAAGGEILFGFFTEAILAVLACLGVLFCLLVAVAISSNHFHHPLEALSYWELYWLAIPFTYLLFDFLVPFAVGMSLARRYPGSEVAGCAALAALHAWLSLISGLIFWALIIRHGGFANVSWVIFDIPLVAWNPSTVMSWALPVLFYLTLYPITIVGGALVARSSGFSKRSAISTGKVETER